MEREFVKSTRNGIMVKCRNEKQYRKLMELQSIGTMPVKVQDQMYTIKGVISGIPTEMSETEIQMELKKQKVSHVKRIMRKEQKKNQNNSGNEQMKLTPTRSVILFFEATTLPQDIDLYFQKFQVKQYIPPVLRCFHCQRFGHAVANCKAKQRCVRCGDPHTFEECPQKDTPKCINCGENHSAAYSGCREVKKAKEIQKLKVMNNLTYAQATRKWQEHEQRPNVAVETQPIPQPAVKETKESTEEMKHGTPRASQPVSHTPHSAEVNNPPSKATRSFSLIPNQSKNQAQPQQNMQKLPQEKEGPAKNRLGVNFVAQATDNELINFIVILIMNLMKDKSEDEIRLLINAAAGKLLGQDSYDVGETC
ncbi:uncharacterized protein [Diadema setosum]|uniref:uncharacterized protein n=1 Tax=Diadema setosum TaxID=31175 RepID=UPI003B3BD1CC